MASTNHLRQPRSRNHTKEERFSGTAIMSLACTNLPSLSGKHGTRGAAHHHLTKTWDEGSSARLVLARERTCESRGCRRSDPPTEAEPKSGLQARGRGGGQKREALLAGAEGGVYQPPETPTQPQSHKRRVVQLHGDYVSRLQKLTIIKREAWDEEGGAPSSHEAWDEGAAHVSCLRGGAP